MNRNAETIRQRLTAHVVAERYGFVPDRSGNINCPFHVGDRQASLHLYPGTGGFCCFGCGVKGSVIDFVMHLFGCSFSEAVSRLNDDFRLSLPLGSKITYRDRKARQNAIMGQIERSKKEREIQAECENLSALYDMADSIARNYAPEAPEQITPGFAWAIKNIETIKYYLLSAEEKRWKLEQTSRGAGMGEGVIPDSGAV